MCWFWNWELGKATATDIGDIEQVGWAIEGEDAGGRMGPDFGLGGLVQFRGIGEWTMEVTG